MNIFHAFALIAAITGNPCADAPYSKEAYLAMHPAYELVASIPGEKGRELFSITWEAAGKNNPGIEAVPFLDEVVVVYYDRGPMPSFETIGVSNGKACVNAILPKALFFRALAEAGERWFKENI